MSATHEIETRPEAASESELLLSGVDFYKPTMSQFAYEHEPDADVTFTFKNRGQQVISAYVDPHVLQDKLDEIADRGFKPEEISYLAGLSCQDGQLLFSDHYLSLLSTSRLPPATVTKGSDLEITTTGKWPLASFWETVVMSQVDEAYMDGYVKAHDLDINDVYAEGDRRLDNKIAYMQAHPDFKVAEFGTRRRFSLAWQKHVLARLMNECPENLVGTSNVGFASSLGLKPVGTYAHELPMVYAGLADERGEDIRSSHGKMLDEWHDYYGNDFSIALTDTFGSDFFFDDFGRNRAEAWKGTRQDSGDPIKYGEKAISFYDSYGIDPNTKQVVFSDSLNIHKGDLIHRTFNGRLGHMFGIGTNFTNDLGIPALNIVMKATSVNGVETVKLSDDEGKHTGPDFQVARYEEIFKSASASRRSGGLRRVGGAALSAR